MNKYSSMKIYSRQINNNALHKSCQAKSNVSDVQNVTLGYLHCALQWKNFLELRQGICRLSVIMIFTFMNTIGH